MFYSERDAIDIYERKYSIQEIWWMDEETGFYLLQSGVTEIGSETL